MSCGRFGSFWSSPGGVGVLTAVPSENVEESPKAIFSNGPPVTHPRRIRERLGLAGDRIPSPPPDSRPGVEPTRISRCTTRPAPGAAARGQFAAGDAPPPGPYQPPVGGPHQPPQPLPLQAFRPARCWSPSATSRSSSSGSSPGRRAADPGHELVGDGHVADRGEDPRLGRSSSRSSSSSGLPARPAVPAAARSASPRPASSRSPCRTATAPTTPTSA